MKQIQYSHDISDFYAGDSINFTVDLCEYKPKDNFNLTLMLISATNPKIILAAEANLETNTYTFKAGNTITGPYTPGRYLAYLILTKSVEGFSRQIEIGMVEIMPNIALSATLDSRSHNMKVLDSIRELLEGKFLDDVANYTINGRSLTKMSIPDLHKMKIYYENEVNREIARKEFKETGRNTSNRIKIRTKSLH